MNRNTIRSINRLAAALQTGKRQRKATNARKSGRRSRGRQNRALPAAYATHVRPRFSVVTRTATTARISGSDLVYPIPSVLSPGQDTLFAVFPCNPAYWSGTRVAQFAVAYQHYRPLRFHVSYIPQVAVTQEGTVFMGTIWTGSVPSQNLQQTLFTSNGGCLTQCFVPCDTEIRCAENLPQNLFSLAGSLGQETNPFFFMAGVRGAQVVPGYFYVTYEYEFKNPVGKSWTFEVQPSITVSQLASYAQVDNMSLTLLSQALNYGPGTVFDYDVSDGGTPVIRYNGSIVTLPSNTPVSLFSNYQGSELAEDTIISTTVGQETVLFSDFKTLDGTVSVARGQSVVFVPEDNTIVFYSNGTGDATTEVVPSGARYHLFASAPTVASVNNQQGSQVIIQELNGGANTSRVILGSRYRIQF